MPDEHSHVVMQPALPVRSAARLRAAVALGLVALLLTSCARDDIPARDRAAAIHTDRDRYVLEPGRFGPEATIVARFTAPKDTTVYILHCNGAISWGLQRLVENRWVDAWVATTNACLSPPFVVPGGGVHADTLTFITRSGGGPEAGPIEDEIQPGTYRVVWFNILTSFDPEARPFGQELPEGRRVSSPITIEQGP